MIRAESPALYRYGHSGGALAFRVANAVLLGGLALAMLYPFVYVVSVSISDLSAVATREVRLLPIGFDLNAYQRIFRSDLLLGSYWNTIYYTTVGVAVSLAMLALTAYPLSIRTFYGRRVITLLFVITMFFSGGFIPLFLIVRGLGFMDTVWALAVPGAIAVFHLIIARTQFEQIPDSLRESAKMDGAGHFRILAVLYLPLSMPMFATLFLFISVGHWNSFFAPLMYMRELTRQPLQVILREILVRNQLTGIFGEFQSFEWRQQEYVPGLQQALRAGAIIVSTGPILLVYPFIQRYFVKGALLGSLKE
jgi:putative aldouronate transport system permease protein